MESGLLTDTIFTFGEDKNETLFMTLINEITVSYRDEHENLMEIILNGDQEEIREEFKRILGLEKDGLL
jgi:hypothetical protein